MAWYAVAGWGSSVFHAVSLSIRAGMILFLKYFRAWYRNSPWENGATLYQEEI